MKSPYNRAAELTQTTESIETYPADRFSGRQSRRTEVTPHGGWILYDGECRHCIAAAARFNRIFARRGFQFIPLQTPWVQRRLGLIPGAELEEMRVVTEGGDDFGGADAILFLARQVWWLRPLWLIGQLPGMHRTIDAGYRWIAAHRGCVHVTGNGSSCDIPIKDVAATTLLSSSLVAALPLLLLPLGAILLRGVVQPWVFMWIMAGTIFLGCKWLTLCRAKQRGAKPGVVKQLAYLFLWAGMDATSFLGPRSLREPTRRALLPGLFAIAEIVAGGFLLFGLARHAHTQLLAGWIGMVGAILILHFGLFDLASVCWRMLGVAARPIMNAPLKSTSLAEFWGRRWNGAFNHLVLEIFFRPFARSLGTVRATLTAFLISGLIHELVISLPAGAGYGLPASYFLLQGWGVIAQRTPIRGCAWLRNGIAGRIFTLGLVAAPAFWLFHPPFVTRVIIPFMQAIRAL